jgi:hypothetical protein
MGDTSTDKIKDKLAETQEEIAKQMRVKERAEHKLVDLRQQERAILTTLKLIGEAPPESVSSVAEAPLPYGSVRGIDGAIQVTTPGEEVTTEEVARRIRSAGLNFQSKNPPNALHTAMSRAPDAFEKVPGTRLFRRKIPRQEQDAPPSGEGLRSNGAALHGGLNAY